MNSFHADPCSRQKRDEAICPQFYRWRVPSLVYSFLSQCEIRASVSDESHLMWRAVGVKKQWLTVPPKSSLIYGAQLESGVHGMLKRTSCRRQAVRDNFLLCLKTGHLQEREDALIWQKQNTFNFRFLPTISKFLPWRVSFPKLSNLCSA